MGNRITPMVRMNDREIEPEGPGVWLADISLTLARVGEVCWRPDTCQSRWRPGRTASTVSNLVSVAFELGSLNASA